MAKLRLISLVCSETEDNTGADEPYLLVDGNEVWGPQSMNDNDREDLRGIEPISFTGSINIKLYDEDVGGWFDDNDLLGSKDVSADLAGAGAKPYEFTKDGGNYTLFCEVLPD